MLVVCVMYNFIRHQVNGEDDEFYRDLNVLFEGSDHKSGEVMIGDGDQTQQSGYKLNTREKILDRDQQAKKMRIDYENYQNEERQS